MNNTEHISDLMAFLYGEMEEQDQKAFAKKLEENPELREEWQALTQTRKVIQDHKPLELAMPPSPKMPSLTRLWLSNPWIQAAVVAMLLMCTAALTGFQLNWNQQEGLHMGFGSQVSNPSQTYLSQTAWQDEKLAQEENWTRLFEQISGKQDSIHGALMGYNQNVAGEFTQLDARIKTLASAFAQQEVSLSEDQFKSIRKEIMMENYQLMTDLMEYATDYQRQYSEQILTDFAQYLNTQRTQDLQMISYALTELLEQNNVQQQETEILLAQLITHIQSDKPFNP